MYDITCVIPLYGKTCEDTSLRMVSSLALQKTDYSVKYLFYYDDTVSKDALAQIYFLFKGRNIDYDVIYSNKTCSGYKRNMGIEWAQKNSKYIWFIDQDDYLVNDDVFESTIPALLKYNLPCIKVTYNIPDYINAFNRENILKTPTMPFQYIIRTDLIDDCRFDEDIEYGSDINYVIKFLLEQGYYKFSEDSTMLNLAKDFPTITTIQYFYNYLNENSYMNKHAVSEHKTKQEEINHAISILEKLKERFDNESN